MSREALGLVVAVSLGVLGAPPALAQESEDEQQARVHFEAGRLHYSKGRFDEAAREFHAAYELSDNAALLYNMFLAYRDADRLPEAVDALETYLGRVSDQPNRAGLEARLRSMHARMEREQAAAPEADEVAADAGREVDDPAEAPAAPVSVPEEPEGSGGVPTGAWVTMAAGGALAVGALVTGLMAKSAESDLHDGCPGLTGCDPALQGTRDRARRLGLATDVLWITGAVTAVGGLIWMLVGRGGDEQRTPDLSFGCGPGGCSVAYERAF